MYICLSEMAGSFDRLLTFLNFVTCLYVVFINGKEIIFRIYILLR